MNMRSLVRLFVATGLCSLSISAGAQEKQPAPAATHTQAEEEALLKQGATSFDCGVAAAIEVKKAKTGHLLVKPVVNGKDAGWFIFDTGAGICVVSTPQVEPLGLTRAGDIEATGVGGGKNAPVYRAKDIQLGAMKLSDVPLMETDLSFLDVHMGEKIAGVIGFGVLSRSVAVIDLEKPAISLFDPATYKLAKGEWTKADIKDRIPVINATFEGHEGRFRLDTGDHTTVIFHAPSVEKYDLLKGRETKDIKVGGVGGMLPAKRGTIASLEIGGMKLENLQADFALEKKGSFGDPDKDGNIGTAVLGKFLLITDYTNERLALVARE